MLRRLERSRGVLRTDWSIRLQIVGTPAASVTRSRSMRSARCAPLMCGPGRTSLAPVKALVKGKPQALAWNMGTTGRTVSLWLTAIESTMPLPMECR